MTVLASFACVVFGIVLGVVFCAVVQSDIEMDAYDAGRSDAIDEMADETDHLQSELRATCRDRDRACAIVASQSDVAPSDIVWARAVLASAAAP